jgi:hypothetical protein
MVAGAATDIPAGRGVCPAAVTSDLLASSSPVVRIPARASRQLPTTAALVLAHEDFHRVGVGGVARYICLTYHLVSSQV